MATDPVMPEPRTPPSGQSCGTCIYYNQFGKQQCVRNPPIVLFAGTMAMSQTDFRSVWPIVKAGDWCGDWKAA